MVLSKTWRPWLTIWTYCESPTSPFVSGGAQLQLTPGYGIPLKLRIVPGIAGFGILDWTTVSRRLFSSLPFVIRAFSGASPSLKVTG